MANGQDQAVLGGRASPEGTRSYAERSPRGEHGYARLGATDLTVSRIGFGGYRVDDVHGDHEAALRKALSEGCNLIDTSTNYTGGRSEKLVGRVVRELAAEGTVRREQLVVVSKIGYVQGDSLELAKRREEQGEPFPEMVKFGDDMWHCIHPKWIEHQLEASLERLGLKTLDVCLLHNPEYYLTKAAKEGSSTIEQRRSEFYRRLEEAFDYLERECERGRIGCYGVSSNTVVSPLDDPKATELARMIETAEEVAEDDHHFRVVQLPLNWSETGAAFEPNDGLDHDQTVLGYAQRQDVGVLVNRPLNALGPQGLVRLADPPQSAQDPSSLESHLDRVADLEHEFARQIGPQLQTSDGQQVPAGLFNWADELKRAIGQVQNVAQWNDVEHQMIRPRNQQLFRALDDGLVGEVGEQWQDWRDRYVPELEGLLDAVRAIATERSHREIHPVRQALEAELPEGYHNESLSRLALWTLTSTPGVSSVLVGMRRPTYVDDALGVLEWPPTETAPRVLERARQALSG